MDDPVEAVRRARWVWLAVSARRGPHVTPMACSWSSGRLWLVAARPSVKVRAIRETPEVMVLVPGPGPSGAVVASGHATLLDPQDPLGLLMGAPELARTGLAAPRYVARHAGLLADLVGRSLAALARGSLPQVRTVLAIELDEVRRTAGVGDAALALDAGNGLELVPATWNEERSVAAFVDPAHAGDARFALSFVTGEGNPPLDGSQLRGRADVAAQEATLRVERVSWWSGLDTGTSKVPPAR